jgi:hypothetical protein
MGCRRRKVPRVVGEDELGTGPSYPKYDALPVVVGTGKVGSPLRATPATFTGEEPFTLETYWAANRIPIPGATSLVYTPVTADVGKSLTFEGFARNRWGDWLTRSRAVVVVS